MWLALHAHVDMVTIQSVVCHQDLTLNAPAAPLYVIDCPIICLEGIESL